MPLFIKIVDAQGNPDPGTTLADLLWEELQAKGVGMFRGEVHVERDLRQVVKDILRSGEVIVVPQSTATCSKCEKPVTVWHTYADGTVLCGHCRT